MQLLNFGIMTIPQPLYLNNWKLPQNCWKIYNSPRDLWTINYAKKVTVLPLILRYHMFVGYLIVQYHIEISLFLFMEFLIGIHYVGDSWTWCDILSPKTFKCYVSLLAFMNFSHMKGSKCSRILSFCIFVEFLDWMLKSKGASKNSTIYGIQEFPK